MKINFIIPFTGVTGGIKVIFEYANRLVSCGHKVNVIFPIIPYRLTQGKKNLRYWYYYCMALTINLLGRTYPKWFSKKINFNLKSSPWICNYFIDDADITVATAWPTAQDVAKLNSSKGKKFYLIQHYEIDSGNKDEVDKSYLLPLNQITTCKRNAEILFKIFGKKIDNIIPYGVDLADFYIDHKKDNEKKRLLLYYDTYERKGGVDGLAALELLKKEYDNFDIVIFGREKPDCSFDFDFVQQPITQEKLRQLYCSVDIFVYPSRYEGFGLPPMEAMACGCAVVATDVGAVTEYSIAGKTALIVPPCNPQALSQSILRLLADESLLNQISYKGNEHINNFKWQNSVDKLVNVFKSTI